MPHNFFGWYFYAKLFPTLIFGTVLLIANRPKRNFFWARFIPIAVAMTALSTWLWSLARGAWYPTLDKYGVIICDVIFLVELFALFFFSFKCSPLEIFLYVMGGWAAEHLGNQIAMLITSAANIAVDYTNYSWQYFLVNVVSYMIVYGAIFGVFYRIIKKNTSIQNKRMLIPAGILLLVVTMLAVFMPVSDMTTEATVITRCYAVACCIITLFLLSGAFEEGRLSQELHILSQLDRKRAEQYEMSRESIEAVNTRCHDLKKLVGQILANKASVDVAEITQELETYDAIVSTGNPAFDTILTEKSLYCEKNDIRLTVMADTKRLSFLSDIDVYSLFGNILDNAIEASLKMKEDSRAIGLTVRSVGDICSIHSDNLFVGTIKFSGKTIATSKQNASEHGFGLTSIRRITEKYGGEMKITAEDGVFNLDIVIPIPKQSA
ncbi:MAG: sensor histidine kinase [Clostridiales bacterium]|nr:sensor histidine kinase [Clostridiales bacterium]